MDARRTNRLFKDFPGVDFCSAEALGSMEIEVGDDEASGECWLDMADVKDCFLPATT